MWSLISIEALFISALVFGFLGRYIAKQKNRSGAEGFWFSIKPIWSIDSCFIAN